MDETESGRTVRIYPLTRIPGRADIQILFSHNEEVEEARFRVLKSRKLENIVRGMPCSYAPLILSRSCASCGLMHALASSIAIEQACGVQVPPAAKALRELVSSLFFASTHITNMLYFMLPDYALPMSDSKVRNVFGIYNVEPEIISRIARVQSSFVKAISKVAGKSINSSFFIPGGVSTGVDEKLVSDLFLLEGLKEDLGEILNFLRTLLKGCSSVMDAGRPLRGFYFGVTDDDYPSFCGDSLTFASFSGEEKITLDKSHFISAIKNTQSEWTCAESISVGEYAPALTGALARANLGFDSASFAGAESSKCFEIWGHPFSRDSLSILAKGLEVIRAWERAIEIIKSESIVGEEVFVPFSFSQGTGCSIVESPAGVIVHEVALDDEGFIRDYRIATPLDFNYQMLNECLSNVARDVVSGIDIDDKESMRLMLCVRALNSCMV
ncbi:MAG: nickel-dependent hydrogenase large subunit [Actinomycetota bacterium]|nr:nickel-dependent hydrogenase large subunit [Actinomycetota bacterium]